MIRLTDDQVRNLINTKPTVTVTVNLSSMEKLKVSLSDIKEDSMGLKYRTLDMDNFSFMITEDQAEQIFGEMEPKLYEETFAEIEDKYLSEKVRADHLEEELELLKERLKEAI